MRALAALLLVSGLMAGCLAQGSAATSDGATGGNPAPQGGPTHPGAVLLDTRFTAAAGKPAQFPVTVPDGARNARLEIQQDSGLIPNLHVDLSGCGGVDPPGSAGRQAYPLCETARAGGQQLTVSVNAGLPIGNGRVIVLADLP